MPQRPIQDVVEALRASIPSQFELDLLVLFGSRARGDEHPGSDWDFAYQARGDVDRLALMASLSAVVGSDRVDVVDVRRAGGLVRFRVARDGLLIYEPVEGTFDQFRLAAARFWFDAEPVLRRGYDAILAGLGG